MCENVNSELSDEAMQILALQDAQAQNALIERYHRLVRKCSRPYFLMGGDNEDLVQEGMVGLLYAIREYNSDKGTAFKTYAETCIRSRILSAVRMASGKKHAPLNNRIPLEEVLSDEARFPGVRYYQRSPEEQVLDEEAEKEFLSAYSANLSRLESTVLAFYLQGLTYQEMAEKTGRDVKAIDNAVQRIRHKLAKLTPGEISKG